ncbi:MAG: hypothetical protein KZQ88_12450 [Candidatus Thiodiazotropha sp. (ex Dulcina madagascariensis)]|nr:hypothetical protein [Candidatus Thiodiazotropha sp. (ex Dulcina madagascariensis)]MCU7926590.1 hypothetical protein [Candidatus Thiodiazotropha sp. (ex Dulcina madagascariensis)]
MPGYQLIENRFVLPSPAGAYYAVSHKENDPLRMLLCALLKLEASPLLTQQALETWTELTGTDAKESLYHAQRLGWIEGFEEPRSTRPGALEEVLPELLPPLCDSGKTLLADSHGFFVAAAGFPHEASVELSALSADIASLDIRHQALTQNNLRLATSAWALVDAAGNSQVGFWPLFIGEYRFVLILQGVPRLNQPAFTSLVWSLSSRYANRNQ